MPYVFGLNTDSVGFNADVIVSSTSARSANASPVELQATDQVRLRFLPKLVDNPNDASKSVEGLLIYERKGKNDAAFPSEDGAHLPISRKSIHKGDYLALSLDTSQTRALYDGVRTLYQLCEDMDGISNGEYGYVRVDSEFGQLSRFIQENPAAAQIISRPENNDLVNSFLRLITQAESTDSLRRSLAQLEEGSLQRLSSSLGLTQIDNAIAEMEANLGNNSEEYWQRTIFGKYQWILPQLFSCPCTILNDKAYVGGKGIDNSGGNVCDFIYQNSITQNVALIEIKTPLTKLLGRTYRQTYCLSNDLSGATNQVLNYRDSLLKDYHRLSSGTSSQFEAFSPKCVIIIGNSEELKDPHMVGAFENYRNSLSGVTIVTFDELIERLKELKAIFEQPEEDDNVLRDYSNDCPF